MAFKRPLPIIARILLGDTFKRLAASVVLMIFMAQSIAFCENCAVAQQFFLTSGTTVSIVTAPAKRAGWQVR
jgi:hypothetical protein